MASTEFILYHIALFLFIWGVLWHFIERNRELPLRIVFASLCTLVVALALGLP